MTGIDITDINNRAAMAAPPSIAIMLNSFEVGALYIEIHKSPGLYRVADLLLEMLLRARREAGVEITWFDDKQIKLRDKYGISVIREPYEWETEAGVIPEK